MDVINKPMKNEIVKIKASDYGLEESKAAEIESMFLPMLAKMRELEKEFNHILKLPINPETCQMARDLRLSYVTIRTGTDRIHKLAKDFYLKGGRFVDGWKNAQAFASGEKEDVLKKIENHFEIIEAEKKAKLKEERIALVQQYVEDVNTFMLDEMTQPAFDVLLAGVKLQYFTRIKAEKQAEADKLAAIESERVRQENIRLDNIRLQKEAEEREKEITAEREKVKKDNEEKERLVEIERKKNAEILAAQQAKADKERAELLAKAESERKEKERAEKELADKIALTEKLKRDAELKLQAEQKDKADAEKKALKAPDKVKLTEVIRNLIIPDIELKSDESRLIEKDIRSKFVSFKLWCETQIKTL